MKNTVQSLKIGRSTYSINRKTQDTQTAACCLLPDYFKLKTKEMKPKEVTYILDKRSKSVAIYEQMCN